MTSSSGGGGAPVTGQEADERPYRGHRLVCGLGTYRWRPTWHHPLRSVFVSECRCHLNVGQLINGRPVVSGAHRG